ncbi:monofunctional biosynthetic peptidoglycan transglycosylase [Kushneria phosphatilytica]|uniref:Biosynthetic peptidoglycan transglycosylase n=1 Tax=Kushneria phosphatilytica TaxID=657387 RepID=A0A1S1NY09_9GAMM|nr:monofunctional biosynthetic peptidoglycan transglycosylase [Kushneria phosphatilytica]OHV12777.1 monofunctional biosynthetic peptidoglycan transglycosylase [Kushneria phosphatilytica]QEL10624.1 monofunctional biosynthetic peptidoglycan transglycosylase [Kushneria phosphatilytica]
MLGRLGRWLLKAVGLLMMLSVLVVVLFRFVPLPGSMVMLERWAHARMTDQSIDIDYHWRSLDRLSNQAALAVIAAEDQRFPFHHGFDFRQIRRSLKAWWFEDRPLRGASTISQQTARNVFLWTQRSWVRKGLEVWFTGLIELLWPKSRILEVYLNVVEWDRGVFGLQAAARHYYGIDADQLSAARAARLAAVLPDPRHRSPLHPSASVMQHARWIRQQMRQLGGTAYLKELQ